MSREKIPALTPRGDGVQFVLLGDPALVVRVPGAVDDEPGFSTLYIPRAVR